MLTGKLVWAVILLGINFIVPPNSHLMYAVFTAIGFDFLTGIVKAKMNNVARTSEGYRRTIVKFLQYFVAIIMCLAAGKLLPDQEAILKQSAGYVMMFIIYIEVTSVFENLYEIDKKKSPFSRYFIKPILTILKFGIENNPVSKAADNINKNKSNENKNMVD